MFVLGAGVEPPASRDPRAAKRQRTLGRPLLTATPSPCTSLREVRRERSRSIARTFRARATTPASHVPRAPSPVGRSADARSFGTTHGSRPKAGCHMNGNGVFGALSHHVLAPRATGRGSRCTTSSLRPTPPASAGPPARGQAAAVPHAVRVCSPPTPRPSASTARSSMPRRGRAHQAPRAASVPP